MLKLMKMFLLIPVHLHVSDISSVVFDFWLTRVSMIYGHRYTRCIAHSPGAPGDKHDFISLLMQIVFTWLRSAFTLEVFFNNKNVQINDKRPKTKVGGTTRDC